MDKIGLLIKKLREDKGLTATELAKKLGVSKVAVSKWETSDYLSISLDNISKVARFFRITVQELCDGKLNEENNLDFIERNYGVEQFDFDSLLANKDIEGLVEYYKTWQRIKTKFIQLLPKYSSDSLNDVEEEAFEYIKKFISVDLYYLESYYGETIDFGVDYKLKHKRIIKKYLDTLNNLSVEERKWELDKIISVHNTFKRNGLSDLESAEPFIEMLKVLNQREKDCFLEENLHSSRVNKTPSNKFLAAIVNSGANVLFDRRCFYQKLWDDIDFKSIEGEIVIDLSFNDMPAECELNFENSPLFRYWNPATWQQVSFAEYKAMINEKLTQQIRDLFNLKYQNPKKYYENLLSGKYLENLK